MLKPEERRLYDALIRGILTGFDAKNPQKSHSAAE
jgi:hypothetical protein